MSTLRSVIPILHFPTSQVFEGRWFICLINIYTVSAQGNVSEAIDLICLTQSYSYNFTQVLDVHRIAVSTALPYFKQGIVVHHHILL